MVVGCGFWFSVGSLRLASPHSAYLLGFFRLAALPSLHVYKYYHLLAAFSLPFSSNILPPLFLISALPCRDQIQSQSRLPILAILPGKLLSPSWRWMISRRTILIYALEWPLSMRPKVRLDCSMFSYMQLLLYATTLLTQSALWDRPLLTRPPLLLKVTLTELLAVDLVLNIPNPVTGIIIIRPVSSLSTRVPNSCTITPVKAR